MRHPDVGLPGVLSGSRRRLDARRQERLPGAARRAPRRSMGSTEARTARSPSSPPRAGASIRATAPSAARCSMATASRASSRTPRAAICTWVGTNRVLSFAIDRPPVCQNVAANTAFGQSVTVTLNCSDPDGDAVTMRRPASRPAEPSAASGNRVNYGPLPGTSGDGLVPVPRALGLQQRGLGPGDRIPSTSPGPPAPPPTGGGGGVVTPPPTQLRPLSTTVTNSTLGRSRSSRSS